MEDGIPYLILEHDGYFVRPLPDDVLDRFDDVLKLDGENPFSKDYDQIINSQNAQTTSIQKYNNPDAKFLHKNETGNYMRGAYGYIIKPHAAKIIVDWISVNGFVPADNQLGDALVDIQVTVPSVVRLHPAYNNRIRELSLTSNPELL